MSPRPIFNEYQFCMRAIGEGKSITGVIPLSDKNKPIEARCPDRLRSFLLPLLRHRHHKRHGIFLLVRQAHRPFREAEFLRPLGRATMQIHAGLAQAIGQDFDLVEFDAEG